MLTPAFKPEHPSQNSDSDTKPSLFLSNALKAARVLTAAFDKADRIRSSASKKALDEPTPEMSAVFP
jgi:hypothetical protein